MIIAVLYDIGMRQLNSSLMRIKEMLIPLIVIPTILTHIIFLESGDRKVIGGLYY
jgi:hypothetical protein